MKNIKIALVILLSMTVLPIRAQSFIREGKVLVASTTKASAKDTLQTDIQWKDSKGIYYPVILNRSNGRCYIWKVSSKTGRYYKYYLKEDACREVCKDYGVSYVKKD